MPLFAATIFLSAALLFLVQPMAGKMLLPLAGGSSAVWNTCMVSFQAALLAGYLYSHLVTTRLKLAHQVILHALLSVCTLGALFTEAPTAPPAEETTLGLTVWLIRTLAVTVGLPFFVVSTTGPLLQRWFSRTNDPRAKDPYFLYAASNIGSSLGLLGYPLFLEPTFNIAGQRMAWAAGFLVLAVLLVLCGRSAVRQQAEEADAAPEAPAEPVAWGRRLMWVMLAAAPSSLMIGVTQHISTDLAAVPLLWVIPLFLYLMTFTVAFSPRVPLSASLLGWVLLPLVLLEGFVVMTGRTKPFLPILVLNLTAFTTAALMCHRRLADDRPSAARLTEFYFFIAVGGVVGGIFNALVAPMVFTLVFEYPAALAACILLRPWAKTPPTYGMWSVGLARLRDRLSLASEGAMGVGAAGALAVVMTAAVLLAVPALRGSRLSIPTIEATAAAVAMAVCAATALAVRRPLVSALPFVAAACVGQYQAKKSYADEHLAFRRSFFGVHHVYTVKARREDMEIDPDKPIVHKLHHGTTLHGAQLFGKMERRRPDGSTFFLDASKFSTTYYHPKGPVGDMMRHMGNTPERAGRINLATLGLADLSRAGLLADLGAPAFPGSSLAVLAATPAVVQAAGDSARPGSPLTSVAVIGLGSGGLAAWARAGDRYTFYEIDPTVREIATTPEYFTFVSDARARGARVDIRIGDGRIEIAKAPDKSFGLIVLDAFSSDSIPVHLLTREALGLYLSKLRDDGVIAFHISNRYFDLRPVLLQHQATFAQGLDQELPPCPGLFACISDVRSQENDAAPRGATRSRENAEFMTGASWVVFGKNRGVLANFTADRPWWVPLEEVLTPAERRRAPDWSDNFSDVLSIFRGWKN